MLICCNPTAIPVLSTSLLLKPLVLGAMLLMILLGANCLAEVQIDKGVEFLAPDRRREGTLRPQPRVISWRPGKGSLLRERFSSGART